MDFIRWILTASRETLFLSGAVLLLLALFVSQSPRALPDVPVHDTVRMIDFRAMSPSASDFETLRNEWTRSADGVRPKDVQSSVDFVIEPGTTRRLQVSIVGDKSQAWMLNLQRDFGRFSRLKVFAGTDTTVEGAQLPGEGSSGSAIKVSLSPRGEPSVKARLSQVRIRTSPWARTPTIFPLPAVIFAPLFPVAMFAFLRLVTRRSLSASARIGVGGAALASMIFLYRSDILEPLWIITASLFLGAIGATLFRHLKLRNSTPADFAAGIPLIELCVVFSALGFGLWTRWEALRIERLLPLRYDAEGYFSIAVKGAFYATGLEKGPFVREPLFPALLRWWFLIVPATETAARALSVLVGSLVAPMTYLAGRKIFSPVAAFLAAGAVALNPFMASLSADVLRDDLLSVLFLAFLCVAVYTSERRMWRAVLLGAVASALVLTRVSNLFLLLPVLGWIGWRQRWRLSEIVLCFFLFILPVLPHLYGNMVHHGDALFSSNVHARYYVNRLHVGESGFPATVADWNSNPYKEAALGPGDLLSHGGIFSTARRIATGYWKIFFWDFPHGELFMGNELVMAFGLIGAWVLARRREAWWVTAAYVIFMFPIAVIAAIVFDERLASPVAPMLLMIWGAGVEFAAINAWMILQKKKRPPLVAEDVSTATV